AECYLTTIINTVNLFHDDFLTTRMQHSGSRGKTAAPHRARVSGRFLCNWQAREPGNPQGARGFAPARPWHPALREPPDSVTVRQRRHDVVPAMHRPSG